MSTLGGDEPELQLGDTGEHVTQLQDRLRGLGLLDAQPHGSFDSATEAAVHQFQSDRGLTVDGTVGPKTWTELDDHMLNQGLQYNPYAGAGQQHWDLERQGQAEHYDDLVAHEATHVQQQGATVSAAEQQVEPHWDGEKWLHYDPASQQWVPMQAEGAAEPAAEAEPHPVPHIDNVHPAVRDDERFSSFHDFMRETHG